MLLFKKKSEPLPPLETLLQKAAFVRISFDRLTPGVDNIRYDVHLSPKLCALVSKMAFQGIAMAARVEDRVDTDTKSERSALRNAFKEACRNVLFSGIRIAGDFKEVQIDHLAQIALHKYLIQESRDQFDGLCRYFKKRIREAENPRNYHAIESVRLKQILSDIVRNRQSLVRSVCRELFHLTDEVQRDPLRKQREASFGMEALLPETLFDNPLISLDSPPEDLFMISEYLLFGQRHEDANRYEALIQLVKRLLTECDAAFTEPANPPEPQESPLEAWIGEPGNMDRLFNAEETLKKLAAVKGQRELKARAVEYAAQAAQQKAFLKIFYRRFQKSDLIPTIAASYEIRTEFQEYCPPLTPHAVLQFLVNAKARDNALDRLKRVAKTENRTWNPDGLWKMTRRVRRLKRREKEACLIRYLKDLSRYHRDLKNAARIREAMDAVHLVTDEKTLTLSRANSLLHEFLLPEEEKGDHVPIVSHVVLKADVRGSTEIIRQMKHQGLNPASFFSLNFFEPINRLLETYEAEKVFIEGDAIILSIFERARPAIHLFTVARACGLAMDILSVVRRCNLGSRKARLPLLEVGIGIGFQDSSPTFLFDGDRRIMISPAINDAHLLCRSDTLPTEPEHGKPPFHLVVYATETSSSHGNPASIYNVNGIALDSGGFRKLAREVDLKTAETVIPEFDRAPLRLHVGRFPTPTGTERILIIREAPYALPHRKSSGVLPAFEQVYFEVCTYPAVFDWAKKHFS